MTVEMKIGYPCINRSLPCKNSRTFRLKSYSEKRLHETIDNNLDCLLQILKFNVAHNILFFRITSDLVPFASHPICTYPWQERFELTFKHIGTYIKENNIRISMHPDQFIVLNTPHEQVLQRSLAELHYHAEVLDLMGLDVSAKIQLHVGGVYQDKEESMKRFVQRYKALSGEIKRRLVIENDDRSYSAEDCLLLNRKIGVPILFDFFHHQLLHQNGSSQELFQEVVETWKRADGCPMVDYSSLHPLGTAGRHAEHIDINDFSQFLEWSKPHNVDIMLEIKDKEKSAIEAIKIMKKDSRFISAGCTCTK